jgi:hypothetical protein
MLLHFEVVKKMYPRFIPRMAVIKEKAGTPSKVDVKMLGSSDPPGICTSRERSPLLPDSALLMISLKPGSSWSPRRLACTPPMKASTLTRLVSEPAVPSFYSFFQMSEKTAT